MTFLQVHLDTECPAIGSGRRIVFVERQGTKWIKVRCPFTLRTARIERPLWHSIERNAKPVTIRKGIIKRTTSAIPKPADSHKRRAHRRIIKTLRSEAGRRS